ncbi:hypothetical protein P8452_64789 [Trifolium repens]|nr:hypothetical protein P8452_64789 [Trifolium repens]
MAATLKFIYIVILCVSLFSIVSSKICKNNYDCWDIFDPENSGLDEWCNLRGQSVGRCEKFMTIIPPVKQD